MRYACDQQAVYVGQKAWAGSFIPSDDLAALLQSTVEIQLHRREVFDTITQGSSEVGPVKPHNGHMHTLFTLKIDVLCTTRMSVLQLDPIGLLQAYIATLIWPESLTWWALLVQEPHYVHAEHMYETWNVSSFQSFLSMRRSRPCVIGSSNCV